MEIEICEVDVDRRRGQQEKILDILKAWKERAEDASVMHTEAFVWRRFVGRCMMIPSIVLSSVSGLANLATGTVENVIEQGDACEETAPKNTLTLVMPFILGGISVASAIISAVYSYLKIGEVVERHNQAAYMYDKFARELEVEIALDQTSIKTYSHTGNLLKECQDMYDSIAEREPNIPRWIVDRYERRKARR